jgi:hypothetical protein
MGNAPTRDRASDLYEANDVVVTSRSSPEGDDVLVLSLGPVLATSRSFYCDEEGEDRKSLRTEARKAAQAQCAMLGGNYILEAKAVVTPARDDRKGTRARDCYIVKGTACIVKRGVDQATANISTSDDRIRNSPVTRKQKGWQEWQFGRIPEHPRHTDVLGEFVAGGVLNAVEWFSLDVDWSF